MVLKHGLKYYESTTSMFQPIKPLHFPIQYISLYSPQIIKTFCSYNADRYNLCIWKVLYTGYYRPKGIWQVYNRQSG